MYTTPFTIVAPTAPDGRPLRDWALGAEALALAALDEGFLPDTLERALADLGPPVPRSAGSGPASLPLPQEPGDWPDLVDAAAAPAADETLWWCRGAELVAPRLLRCIGLPTGLVAASMIGKKEGQGSALDPLGP